MSAIPADQQYRLMTGNADTIQAMGMMPALTSVWEKSHTESLEHQNVASKRGGELLSVSKFIRFLMQVLMLRGGAYLIILNVFTPGMMIAGTILLARALAPVEQTIGTWRQVVQAREAYGRLKDYLINPPPRSEVGDLPAPTGALFVRELSYQLQGMEKPILFNIACDVTPGMMLVLAGPSAAGKSTLAKLMTGVIPATRGHARLDGADLFQWSREEVGQYIGYLPQSPALFLGTIAENIARMQPDRQDEVIEVAKLVGIHELILKLPNGYDTPVGFSDLGLSGGQLQMIALARALFGSPQLIVLDEPTTYLDANSKQMLANVLKQLKEQGKTVVVVTHQPEIIHSADRVLMLRDGVTFLYGPTEKVLEALNKNQQQNKSE